MVGVSVGRVSGVLLVDAAFAVCVGISKFPSVRAGLGWSSFGRVSRGTTYVHMISSELDLYDMCVDVREDRKAELDACRVHVLSSELLYSY